MCPNGTRRQLRVPCTSTQPGAAEQSRHCCHLASPCRSQCIVGSLTTAAARVLERCRPAARTNPEKEVVV